MYGLKNWKKHSLGTHFAGGNLLNKNGVSQKTIDRMTKAIIDCVVREVECPIYYTKDIFSNGVYYNRCEKVTYVKLNGLWYEYKNGGMFEYYSIALIVHEMDTKEHNAILNIAETKYATQYQRELAEHVKNFYYFKKMRLDANIRMKKLKQRIADHKAQKSQGK